jgi:hypothetical protein
MTLGRKTGGRKKGSRNKRPRELIERIEALGVVPLEYMLSVMRDETARPERCDEIARATAPFVHPKLAAVKISDDKDVPLFINCARQQRAGAFEARRPQSPAN